MAEPYSGYKMFNHPLFCANLVRLRNIKGYTQEEMAAKMQLLGSIMTRSTYSKIELGIRNVKVTDLVALKIVLGIQYDDLFEGISPDEKRNEYIAPTNDECHPANGYAP